MNREIKFRFWLGHIGKMTYEHSLSEVGKIIPDFTEDIIPLQYTGLKDNSGKEIYEGDVIEATNHRSGRKTKSVVKFHADVCESGFHFGSIGWYQEEIKVIGNIFENAELLTAPNES